MQLFRKVSRGLPKPQVQKIPEPPASLCPRLHELLPVLEER